MQQEGKGMTGELTMTVLLLQLLLIHWISISTHKSHPLLSHVHQELW